MKTGVKPSRRRWMIIFLVVIVAAFILWHYLNPAPIQWKTVEVAQRALEQNVMATGKLDAVRKVDVGAQVSGQLQSLYVEIGDTVKKDQLLAEIDPQQAQNQVKESEGTLRELSAQLVQARAQYQLSRATAARKQQLAQRQAVSRQELDEATTDMAVKQAAINTIEAQIARNKASLDTAKTNLEYTRIIAPMDGVVTQITTLQGQTVIAAQQAPNILTLANLDTMLVKAQVSEADVIHLRPGQKAWFTVLGDPNTRYEGTLKDILPTPEKINDAIFYYARFEVPNPHHLLRLDMTAQVHIMLDAVADALVIPLSALGDRIGDNRYHIAVLENGKPIMREVTIGLRNNVDVQLVSGAKKGDKVIPGYNLAEAP